jgi:predicted acyl esterase
VQSFEALGEGLTFLTAPLVQETEIIGPSAAKLFVSSSTRDADLFVVLRVFTPDMKEVVFQGAIDPHTPVGQGWLRASHRKLDVKRSTALDPFPTHLKADAAPLRNDAYALVRVPVFPVAHAFRAGSRIRVSVQAPGGDRPRWDFDTVDRGTTRNTIALGYPQASQLVLPVLRGADAQGTPLPPATALRGEPNRAYAPASNGG